MRPAILTAFLLLAACLFGCKPAAPAAFPITDVLAPAVSPDDRPQFDEPTKPVSVPAVPAKAPELPAANYERCTGPGCGERGQPVRGVIQRLPIVRRFGR